MPIIEQQIAQAKKDAVIEVADEIITAIEVYDTKDLDTVTSLYKYAVALKKQAKQGEG